MRSTKSNYSFRRRHVHIEFFRTFVVTKPYQSMNHDKAYHIIRITLAIHISASRTDCRTDQFRPYRIGRRLVTKHRIRYCPGQIR
jgi:KaiC/GvpD/RAD55 family RecA-like ATPase